MLSSPTTHHITTTHISFLHSCTHSFSTTNIITSSYRHLIYISHTLYTHTYVSNVSLRRTITRIITSRQTLFVRTFFIPLTYSRPYSIRFVCTPTPNILSWSASNSPHTTHFIFSYNLSLMVYRRGARRHHGHTHIIFSHALVTILTHMLTVTITISC